MAFGRQITEPTIASDGVKRPSIAGLSGQISALAQSSGQAARAKGCLIAYRALLEVNCVWAANQSTHTIADARIAELLAQRAEIARQGSAIQYLTPSDAAVLRSVGVEIEDSARSILFHLHEGPALVWVALMSAPASETAGAVAELAARSTLALIESNHRSQQASFWRTQASELRDRLTTARAQFTCAARDYTKDIAAKRRLAADAERGNLSAVASGLSRLGPFQGWIIAAPDQEGLRIAGHNRVAPEALRESATALIRGLRRLVPSAAENGAPAAKSSQRGLLRTVRKLGYTDYVSVPLGYACVLLLAQGPIPAGVRTRVGAFRAATESHLRSYFLERELERQRALTGRLVQGLFATADAERASLRRDLHDDWAQLLAAAQIAINGDGHSAQKFFRQLERKLRQRLDALRPRELRRISLERAVERELRRLDQAGIRATAKIHGLKRIPASIRAILIHVIAEGVSNVILHSGADRAHIEVQRRVCVACYAVTDNGRGAHRRDGADGAGLRGLTERVAVLGGNCKLGSTAGSTELRAEIPVAEL